MPAYFRVYINLHSLQFSCASHLKLLFIYLVTFTIHTSHFAYLPWFICNHTDFRTITHLYLCVLYDNRMRHGFTCKSKQLTKTTSATMFSYWCVVWKEPPIFFLNHVDFYTYHFFEFFKIIHTNKYTDCKSVSTQFFQKN